MDGAVFFQEADTRPVGVALAEVACRRADRNAAKADIRVILDAQRRLVRTGGQDDGATEIERIAVVRKSDDPLERLRKIGTATHERDKRSETRYMLERIVPELGRIVENLTDKRKNLVAKTQIVFVVDAIISHII